MNPIWALRQCAMARSVTTRRSWPRTRISPSVGRSMAAIRCSKVDLPEPEGPIRATNSPRVMVMSTSLSATTRNSSRTYSLVSWCVSITVSAMSLLSLFRPHFLPILQTCRRIDDDIFAANQAFDNFDTLRRRSGDLDGLSQSLPADYFEHRAIAHGRARHRDNRFRFGFRGARFFG